MVAKRMQRLFVTGGTGYLGRTLIQLAGTQGWQVGASYFRHTPPLESSVRWFALDVRDGASVAQVLSTFQPDVVIHTAFRQHDPDLWAVTATGACHVAIVVQQLGARLIHLSSDVIFDGERDDAYTERDRPDPITAYGRAKAYAEQCIQELCPTAVIVRTSLIYGFEPLDRHTQFVLNLVQGTLQGQLFQDEYRCPIFVVDLALALLELARNSFQGVLHVAGAERMSRFEFGTQLARAYGYDPARLQSGLSTACPERRPRNCTLDIRLAQSLLRTPLRGVSAVLATHAPYPDSFNIA